MAKAATASTPNAFVNQPDPPTDSELAAALGPTKALWDQLLAALADEHELVIREWNSYSRKAGWALRVKRVERNILYLSPCQGWFLASLALGDKAVQAARQGSLPPRVLRIISEARRYAEGTAVRLEVHTAADIAAVIQLAAIKLKN